MAKLDRWSAARGGVALLLLGGVTMGFSEPAEETWDPSEPIEVVDPAAEYPVEVFEAEGESPVEEVGSEGEEIPFEEVGEPMEEPLDAGVDPAEEPVGAGDPAGEAMPEGVMVVTGQILSIDLTQALPTLEVATPLGQVLVYLTDPALAMGLAPGMVLNFAGQPLSLVEFVSFGVVDDSFLLGDALSLGVPLDAQTLISLRATPTPWPSTSYGAPRAGGVNSSTTYSAASDGSTGGGSTGNPTPTKTPTATKTPTPGGKPNDGPCRSDQRLSLNVRSDDRLKAGDEYKLDVYLDTSGDCEDERVYLQVVSGPNAGVQVSEQLDDENYARVDYTDAAATGGTDQFVVWLDLDEKKDFDVDEPNAFGLAQWSTPTPTPTPKPTNTPTPTGP